MEELLEKIPVEKRRAITAKFLITFAILRGVKTVMPLLGKGEGIISHVWGLEKWREIVEKIWEEGGRKFFPRIKEVFNIPVEDAIGAAKLWRVTGSFVGGPEAEGEIVKATPERTVFRWTKCTWMEIYKAFKVDPEFITCDAGDQAWGEAGLKAVNPKLTSKLVKAMPWGDPYCEFVFEFKVD